MRLLCVIPARIGSTRLSNKPLRLIAGIPLIRLVTERVLGFRLGADVVVATDDPGVIEAVRGLPVDAVLTDPGHGSGTERVAEVAARAPWSSSEIVLNVQGDEPFVEREALTGAVGRVRQGDDIGTAAAPLGAEQSGDPNRVKVQLAADGRAVKFSRAAIPATRGGTTYLQHVGVYAFTRAALSRWMASAPVAEERAERLEQLRPLASGLTIGVAVLPKEVRGGIDTEEDWQRANHTFTFPSPAGGGTEVRA